MLPDQPPDLSPDLTDPSPKSIFISYRREDSEEVVDRVHETLGTHISDAALFRDVDDIEPGAHFPRVIRERLRDCDVVLVFIGRDWLSAQRDGRPRLDDPDDSLRQEIQAALAHPSAQLIPVLVKHAAMPTADQLPLPLRPLAEIHAIELRSRGKEYLSDVAALADAIRRSVALSRSKRQQAARPGAADGPSVPGRDPALVAPALEADRWTALIGAARDRGLVVICGSEFGTDRTQGDPVCREYAMAAEVSRRLNLASPRLDAHRPLATLAAASHESGRRDAFAHALGHAARALGPASGLAGVNGLDAFGLLITSALDRGLEAVLEAHAGRPVTSVHYTPKGPLALEEVEFGRSGACVLHAAGYAGGVDGDAALTDAEWREFARTWRERMPERLSSLFEGAVVLCTGAGSPAGFVAFWADVATRLRCHSLWIGSSALAGDAAWTRSLDLADHMQVTLFDDSDGAAFLAEFDRRWACAEAPKAPPAVPAAAPPAFAAEPQALAAQGPPPVAQASIDEHPKAVGMGPDHLRPWPGLAAYSEDAAAFLFGREREIDQVLQAIAVHPVTVLYGKSGLGKSSLLRAGVCPRLRARRLIPVVLRIDWSASAHQPPGRQVLRRVSEEAAMVGLALPAPGADDSPWSYFHRRDVAQAGGPDGLPFVLMFDQFEELFTAAGEAPVTELADLVEDRVPDDLRERVRKDPSVIEAFDVRRAGPRILIAVREDYLAELNALGHLMPGLRRAGIRLLGLSHDAAYEAMLQAGGGIFTPQAASALLQKLTSHGAPDRVGNRIDQPATVEPVLLSLTCYRLNQIRLARGLARIEPDLVDEAEGPAIDSFYAQAFADLDPALRRWVARELVTASGHRDSVSLERAEESLRHDRLSRDLLDRLVDRRVLRITMDSGVGRVELVHDVLVPVARRAGADAGPRESAGRPLGRPLGRLLGRMFGGDQRP